MLGDLSRRGSLQIAAASAALYLPHIRSARAASTLSVALIDSFVPNATDVMRRLIEQWGRLAQLDVRVDFLAAVNGQQLLTQAAEAQARTGHDIMHFFDYDVATYADQLEPVGDVVDGLIAKNGPLTAGVEDYAKLDGTWRAVPAGWGSLFRACVTRIDLFREHVGLDVVSMCPAAPEMGPGYPEWTWDAFLLAAEKCFKAGYPFGLQISSCQDANAWIDALLRGFGASLFDAKGNITVRSDAMRQALEHGRRIARVLPPDVYSWNNASDNRAMISGKAALIFDPPSPWAGALQDNPALGAQIWHHPMPAGPHGRYVPFNPGYFGIWNFSRNTSAAKALIAWLCERAQVEAACNASHGYDIPPFVSMLDFPVWTESGPPKGTLYNYPMRPAHHARTNVAGAPAPPAIAHQIQNQWVLPKMLARVAQSGMSIEDSITEAERELEGFMR